jgi:heat shock protein HslJ
MQERYRKALVVFIILFIFLNNLFAQEKKSDTFSIVGRWELTAINEQSISKEIFTEGNPYIEIKDKDQVISGFTGCNVIRGQLTISGNKIKIEQLISSKRFCEGIPEHEILNAIKLADSYTIKGKMLFFLNNESVLLSFIMTD